MVPPGFIISRRRSVQAAGFALVTACFIFGFTNSVSTRAQSPEAGPQTATGGNATFDVASIKPNHSGGRPQGLRVQPGGRLTAVNVPVRLLIAPAYRLTPTQIRLISGAPD